MKLTLLVALVLSIVSVSNAASPTKTPKVDLKSLPEIAADFAPSPLFDPLPYKDARKPAGEFSENQMSKDMKELRDRLAQVKSADEFEALIVSAKLTMKDKSDDAQFVIAQAATLLPMRGIVWRLRPLFEQSRGFLGTKSTHVAAVQLVREVSATLAGAFPSKASDMILQFALEPSSKMSTADQFRDVPSFQNFLIKSVAPAHHSAAKTIGEIIERNPKSTFVFDNKMAFGKGTFTDGIERFVGFAAPEMHLAAAAHLAVLNETYVFCSYNQNSLIDAIGKLGAQMGLDSTMGTVFTPTAGLGITDQERVRVIKSLSESGKFLTRLEGYERAMKSAYAALVLSVRHTETAHTQLLSRPAGRSFAVDSFYFLKPRGNLTAANVKTAVAAVAGPIEIRDPITAEVVRIDVPKFYSNPPAKLTSLMASAFVLDEPVEKSKPNTVGEKLVYRNYAYGSAKGWSNEDWKTYVPSATGKGSEYMGTVRRVVARNPGAAAVFGLPAIFVH
jgi:hypothetical protein